MFIMNALQKFLQKRAVPDGTIRALYKDFKQFICCDELPDFKINYVDSRSDKSITYKASVDLYRTEIWLNVNIAFYSNYSDFKNLLVHEFTHIYDFYILSKKFNKEYLRDNMKLYTEYHAYQIECLYSYHVVNNIQETLPSSLHVYQKLTDIPTGKALHFANKCKEFILNQTFGKFEEVKVAYLYYCGAEDLFSFTISREISSIPFLKPYTEFMDKIKEILKTVDYKESPTEEQLNSISELNKQINILFFTIQKQLTQ